MHNIHSFRFTQTNLLILPGEFNFKHFWNRSHQCKKKKEKSTFAPKCMYEDDKNFLEFINTHLEKENACKQT